MRTIVVIIAIAIFVCGAVAYSLPGVGAPVFPQQACNEPSRHFTPGAGTAVAVLVFASVFGVFAICISLALLDFFALHVTEPHPWWLKSMSRAAYAAYLVHPWVLIAAQWAYVAVVVGPENSGWPKGSGVVPPSGACLNGPDGGSGLLLWGGFFITAAVAIPGSFAAGIGLVSLSFLRDVL